MRYKIHHRTVYDYNQPVYLSPHLIRLKPKSNGWQFLQNFHLNIKSPYQGKAEINELDGNNCFQIWFQEPLENLVIETYSEVETKISNPFNYLLGDNNRLPFDYPVSLYKQLQPYLQPYGIGGEGIIGELTTGIVEEVRGDLLGFLYTLNDRIYRECSYINRQEGEPWEPRLTWQRKRGSCRDLVVLFMDACRLAGLATRFVSGYEEGDREQDSRDLHAWAEVYIPFAGWRGYDPTHGLAVSDRHVTLVSSALPGYCAPVVGTAKPVNRTGLRLESRLSAEINLERVD